MIRKAALQAGAILLLALMVWNAYVAIENLRQAQQMATLTLESSRVQMDIAAVLADLADMETGQRGFLLTANRSYLQPYDTAKAKIATDFAALRSGLGADAQEVALESQLEALAKSKQEEMERSIKLRQQGYRHRAFVLVDSNEGMEYMDKARGVLSTLAASQTSSIARFNDEKHASLRKAFVEIIFGNLSLLGLTICLLILARHHGHVLESNAAHSRETLAVRNLQLQKLTSALAIQARAKTSAIEQSACLLLEQYGGFLPKQGHECAEQIMEASAQMERLRQDLVAEPEVHDEAALCESVA